jgi:hypothetical protein
MTTKFRVPIAGLSAVLLLLIAAIPEAESHSKKRGVASCTEGDPTCWVKPSIRSSCNFWDADCSRGRRFYHHQRYEQLYNGYSPYRGHHHQHFRDPAPNIYGGHHHYHGGRDGWSQRYWETRFYHRRYANYRRWWRPRQFTWIDRDYTYAGGLHCLPPHREVGDEASSRSKAIANVEKRWAHSISYDRGAKYSNLDRAKHGRLHCDPTGQSRWLKTVLWTCVMTAEPCRANQPDQFRDNKRFINDEITIERERD